MKKYVCLILTFIVIAGYRLTANADIREHINLPGFDELYCIHFDNNGLLWLGTSSGIMSYDGYMVRNEFSRYIPVFPQLASDIRSITADNENHLWAGSNNGLLRIDLTTGYIRQYIFPKQSQQIIYKLFTSRNGTVYVGTDDGFSVYNRRTQTFRHFNLENSKAIYPNGKTGRYRGWGVKDFVEDNNGNIIIGTWQQGLWHFSPKTSCIRAYGKINDMNSAFALCIDKKRQLWIGTQGCGVQRMTSADDYQAKSATTIDIDKDKKVVYDILQLEDNSIYICSDDTIGAQTGPDGALWLATRQGGLQRVLKDNSLFYNHNIGNIRSIFSDNGTQFFLGYAMTGLAWYDSNSRHLLINDMIPGFSAIPSDGLVTKVTSIVRRYNNDIWAAASDNGIFIKHADNTSETLYPNSQKMPFIKDNVTSLYEDKKSKVLWIGQRKGISFILPDGHGQHLDVKNDSIDITGYFMVNSITGDHNGNVWVASANRGIVRISGNPDNGKSLKFKHFTTQFSNITACYEDSRHGIWAICSGGLLKYDVKTDKFDIVNKSFHLADRAILSINEDVYGCIWLATDKALVRLDKSGNTISFTEQDGLASTAFFANATFKYRDRLFFGTAKGMVGFKPAISYQNYRNYKSNIIVTDIMIDGTSVLALDSTDRIEITETRPASTKQLYIPANARTFSIEFALLNYASPGETKYAYILKGYDDEWQYTDGTIHSATYSHVPAGKYTFILKAADSHGNWKELPYDITVRVKAPWYASWWAYAIYLLAVIAISRIIWKYMQMKHELEASRRFSSIVQSTQIHADNNSIDSNEGKSADNKNEESITDIKAFAEQQKDAEFIAKATQLVYDHLTDADYNRDRMAADFNMSRSTLYGRMRECTGLSIQNFIQTIRLNAASEILSKEPNIRINELAYRVGFNTPKYFSQCFKKKFGVLPGNYIK